MMKVIMFVFSLLLMPEAKSMHFPFAEFQHLDRQHRPREASVYDSLATEEQAYSKFLEHIDVTGTLINPMSRENKLFNEAMHRIISNPVGLELIKIIATKLERKKIVWESILAQAEEIKRQQHNVNAEITKLISRDPTASTGLIKGEFYKAKNFLRLLLRPGNPNSYDINTFITGSDDISAIINTNYSASDQWSRNAEELETKIGGIPSDNSWGSVRHNVGDFAKVYENIDKIILRAKKVLDSRKLLFEIGSKNCFQPHINSQCKVTINFSLYKDNGYSQTGGHYYISSILDENSVILGCKQKTLHGSIFHEFLHGLHEIEGRRKSQDDALLLLYTDPIYRSKWSNDEELLNITGVFYEIDTWMVDPISIRRFDMSQTTLSVIERMPRHLHIEPKLEEKTVLSAPIKDERKAAEAIMKAHGGDFILEIK